jgi:hypothetical protein
MRSLRWTQSNDPFGSGCREQQKGWRHNYRKNAWNQDSPRWHFSQRILPPTLTVVLFEKFIPSEEQQALSLPSISRELS